MPQSYLVCRSDELKDGDRRVMSCDGTEVGVFKVDGQLVGALSLTVEHGRITRIFSIANPDKLERLDVEAPLAR